MIATGAPPAPAARPRIRPLPHGKSVWIYTLSGAALVLLLATLSTAWTAVSSARDAGRVIGRDAGPQVIATGALYHHLTDMDAQLATALLLGGSDGRDAVRSKALARYERSRAGAGDALLRAAKLADEPMEERTARDTLDALARYERAAGQALMLGRDTAYRAGRPPAEVVAAYRKAGDVMKLDLLPKASNLTLRNGALVRGTYESEVGKVGGGRSLLIVWGLLTLVVLVFLQVMLYRWFRRVVNPALVLATVGVLALTWAGAAMLGGQTDHLDRAKRAGFDPLLSLSRDRGAAASADADEIRFLLDPERRALYTQTYLSKFQAMYYVPADTLDSYQGSMSVALLQEGDLRVREGERRESVLRAFIAYQQRDGRVRDLVADGRVDEAVRARHQGRGSSAAAFAAYDREVVAQIDRHRSAFKLAVARADDGTRGWNLILPAAGLAIVVLVAAGVRPRLAEYR